ncbi:MAG: peptidoglycan DD-metalloendopeptidase family protein [Candidatus Eisenbacteria bacterium]|nr:peptidoglycan DD-metalloendopeptidase family protein [Candidatus Eisenbacteria bacterium]
MKLRSSQIGPPLAAILTIAAIVTLSGAGCTPLPSSGGGATSSSSWSSRTGVHHTVRKGETLWRISKAYGVSLAELLEANDLQDYTIRVGQKLYIPGVSKTVEVEPAEPSREEVSRNVGGKLSWPLAGRGRSSVTSGFGERKDPMTGGTRFHKGIDIDGAREERVLAAAGGEVVYSGGMSGFGTVVMIDHGDRLLTVYAHLSRSIVRLEDVVSSGDTIGYVGSTGRSNGTHLHFEVRYKGVSVDPLDYLP